MLELISKTALWLIVEFAIFNIVVVFLFRTHIVFSARDETGEMKRKQTPKSLLAIAGFLILSHGRRVGYPTHPAQIPACGITALGSSIILASVIKQNYNPQYSIACIYFSVSLALLIRSVPSSD